MKSLYCHSFAALLLLGLSACGDDGGSPAVDASPVDAAPTPDAADIDAAGIDAGDDIDAGLDSPLDGIGAVELVDEGYMFLEGPVWRADDGVLLFSDIPANLILRLQENGTIDEFRNPSGNANGLVLDPDGLLLAAEHGNRRVSRTLADGTVEAVADSYQGDAFNSPNDIAVRSDGVIYFTDPPYGLPDPGDREIDFNGVYRVATDGAVTAEWMGGLDTRPNGLVLSPDEGTLYVADTADGLIRAFSVAADGALTEGDDFATGVPSPDGMAIDEDGNLFVTTSDGVQVYAPDGSLWGTITLDRQPSNCTFGGPDGDTLYITAREGLYQVALAGD